MKTNRDINNFPEDLSNINQLKKYARDLTEIYKSEKEKRKELKVANKQLMNYADALNKTVLDLKSANRELQHAYQDTIHRLVLASEFKDKDTGGHITRICRYSALIAEKLGLKDSEIKNILYAAPMHDVGKIGIPEHILLKPGKLSETEFKVVQTHTTIGASILANSKSEILQIAQEIAIAHHEKWNGKGYPQGLSGKDIPLAARIVAIADTFDALTTRRPYKDPYPVEVACDILRKEREEHFDPDVVDVFLKNIDEVLAIKKSVDIVDTMENTSSPNFTWSERDQIELT